MTKKPKLLFVFDHKYEDKWQDGLWAALNLLEKDFKITKYNIHKEKQKFPYSETLGYDPLNLGYDISKIDDDLHQLVADEKFDFVLGWGGFHSTVDHFVRHMWLEGTKIKKGLCIGGNAFPPEYSDEYDVLFYETKWYRPEIKFHKNIVHAFGINTDIYFKVNIPYPIVWDYIGVGSFSNWKRWEKMIEKKGNRLVIGEFQEGNEKESLAITKDLIKGGVMVSGMINPMDLSNLLNYARKAYIPANTNGGGERAVLEARACGLEVEVEKDNSKLEELLTSPIYDQYYYSSQLKKGILSCL